MVARRSDAAASCINRWLEGEVKWQKIAPCVIFFFSYVWIGEKRTGYGNLCIQLETFPSNNMLKKLAADRCSELAEIVITTWNEFKTEQDFRAFIFIGD